MTSTIYLIIGIVLALAGFGMLFSAMASSPALKKNREKLRKKAAENHRPEKG
ncbi:hypothetical protein ACFSO0_12580 [Brevibacillus sp. GCM10020057]|uniref:hypothetical protein n=1 Tax=Brevibacillus sp. GCM10020057 TaxID=3317327 RepID=UPI003625B65A